MKNCKSSLYLVALVSLIYLFTPSGAFAQDGGGIPPAHLTGGEFQIPAAFAEGDSVPIDLAGPFNPAPTAPAGEQPWISRPDSTAIAAVAGETDRMQF
jgi:hypothetical protein